VLKLEMCRTGTTGKSYRDRGHWEKLPGPGPLGKATGTATATTEKMLPGPLEKVTRTATATTEKKLPGPKNLGPAHH
jgi:hypothetical protein